MYINRHFSIDSFRLICFLLCIAGAAAQATTAGEQPVEKNEIFALSIEELMDVDVTTASKKAESLYEAPGVMTVIPREEIEAYGDRDLHQLLQRQPSVYTRDVYPYTDNVAGFRGDMSMVTDSHTLILFNGRPIRESAQGLNVNMYKALPLSVLESVELIRGPGSVLYGSNAFTGIVNLKPRVPDKNEISVSAMTGSYGYYKSDVTVGGKAGEFGYTTAFQVAGQQGYPYEMTDGAGVYDEDNKQYKSYSGIAHLNYENFTFDGFWSDYDAFAIGVVPFWSNPHKSFRDKKLFLNAGYQIPMHERVKLELNATYNMQENGLTSFKPEIIQNNTSDILGEATLFVEPVDNFNLVLGYLYEQRSNYHPDGNYHAGGDKYQSIRSYRHEPQSFYAQGDYKVDKYLKLIAGTQWNKSSYGCSDWISRFGLIITPFDKWGVKLLRGEAFRAPTTVETDLYDPGILRGNSNLEPETITTYDAQLFYHGEKTYAAVTYFHSKVEKLIIYDTSAVPDMSYMNGGTHSFDGIEFEGKYFFTPSWHVLCSYMHQENEADAGLNPTVVPENMFKLGTAYKWDWGTASAFYVLFGNPPEIYYPSLSPPFGSTLVVNKEPEEIHLVNMNLDLDVSKWMGLNKGQSALMLRVENLFDEKIFVPTLAYSGTPNSFPYSSGRTWFVGWKLSF
ncbi:MAG: TonB-dependent receptor [Sedimentisphaerales bacterium]|nr:TonB-dependent receptor [Sedimentisphaerales bacterium]